MTTKHYVAIAGAIAAATGTPGSKCPIIYELAVAMAADNPRFIRSTFVRACGVRDETFDRWLRTH